MHLFYTRLSILFSCFFFIIMYEVKWSKQKKKSKKNTYTNYFSINERGKMKTKNLLPSIPTAPKLVIEITFLCFFFFSSLRHFIFFLFALSLLL